MHIHAGIGAGINTWYRCDVVERARTTYSYRRERLGASERWQWTMEKDSRAVRCYRETDDDSFDFTYSRCVFRIRLPSHTSAHFHCSITIFSLALAASKRSDCVKIVSIDAIACHTHTAEQNNKIKKWTERKRRTREETKWTCTRRKKVESNIWVFFFGPSQRYRTHTNYTSSQCVGKSLTMSLIRAYTVPSSTSAAGAKQKARNKSKKGKKKCV